jgi:hypothetical protein
MELRAFVIWRLCTCTITVSKVLKSWLGLKVGDLSLESRLLIMWGIRIVVHVMSLCHAECSLEMCLD